MGKACKVLTSSGIAPNISETWHLLLQKHPKGPVPSCPEVTLPSEGFRLPPDLNIMSVLHQFSRDSASGPSGLRIQHLIDAAEVHMATPICASLRAVINILAGGKAPAEHPTLWHTMGTLRSEQGVQQGDPLGPLLFSLVLHKLVRSIAVDSECSERLFNMWYLDDSTLAGPKDAVKHAIHLIQQFGPSLGLYINMAKCELFSQGDIEGFPADIKVLHEPNFEILGAPIGDALFCAKASQGSQIAVPDVRARSTPPAPVSEGLALFDAEVCRHFFDCVAIDPSDSEWLHVQLSLSRGGLGLRSLVPPTSSISEESLLESCLSQKDLSSRIDDHQFDELCLISTLANRARLLSVIVLDPDKFQVALKWLLGMDTSSQLRCPYCPDHQLDPLGHHAVTW
ncbi:hypothetical protein EMCRGX_G004288 [Ephydatia muelleri]